MWGAENMSQTRGRSGWRLFCFGVSWLGPFFSFAFFFSLILFLYLCPVYAKKQMGFVDSVGVTSDISV